MQRTSAQRVRKVTAAKRNESGKKCEKQKMIRKFPDAFPSLPLPDDMDVSKIDEARLIRKIDRQLLPWLSLLYLLSFLDRTSIGNAKVR